MSATPAPAAPSLLDRMDDWLNPIVVKELRQAVKSRIVIVILMVFLVIQLFVMGSYLSVRTVQAEYGQGLWNGGLEVFTVLQWVLLPTLMLIIPAHATVRFAAERSDQNVDLLFISALKPSSIVWGKFFAAIVLAMLILSLVAPFMVFSYLMRGLDIPTILLILGIDLLGMVSATMAGMFLAAIPGPRPVKFFFALVGFISLAFLTFGGFGSLSQEILRGNVMELGDPLRFAATFGTLGVALLSSTVILYFYTVAMISPPSCNRDLPVRLAVLGYWLVTGAGASYLTWHLLPHGRGMAGVPPLLPMGMWLFLTTAVLCLQLVISICERESWGARVAKTIPANPVLRVGAFLLYTGSAGGILFTLLLMLATLGIGWAWTRWDPTTMESRILEQLLAGAAGAMIYTLCYGLSALLVRHYFMAEHLKPGYTWLVVALLVGLGTCIPAVVAFTVFQDSLRQGNDGGWWYLPNPFAVCYEFAHTGGHGRDPRFEIMAKWFLGTWGAVVGLLSIPYIVQQALLFRPYQKKAAPAPPVPQAAAKPESGPAGPAAPDAITAG